MNKKGQSKPTLVDIFGDRLKDIWGQDILGQCKNPIQIVEVK
jgi:hypothetical protein